MKTFMPLLLLCLALPLQAATSHDEDLRDSDRLAAQETETLQAFYWEGLRHWQEGDTTAALNAFDYAAWQGSPAAARRLCVMDAYGIGTARNPLKAAFWCERAAAAGEDMAELRARLQAERIAEAY